MACSMLKEERRIITNSKVNYSLIRMDCPLPSLSHTLLFSFFSHVLSWNDTGENLMAVLAFHVVSGRDMEVSFLPSGWGAERLTALGNSWYPHPVALFQRIVCTWWTGAKFKHSPWQLLTAVTLSMMCSGTRGETGKVLCLQFSSNPQPTNPVLAHFVVYIDTILAFPPLPKK